VVFTEPDLAIYIDTEIHPTNHVMCQSTAPRPNDKQCVKQYYILYFELILNKNELLLKT
jgi:hypothetical protein